MKIEKISSTDYKVYIYSRSFDENEITEDVRDVVLKLKRKLKLRGFYKIVVCLKELGMFLQIIKIEDSYYKDSLDLRIVLKDDIDIYFKSMDYFAIDDSEKIIYYDGYFYALVEDSFDKIIEKVEFGDFVFGPDIEDILDNGLVI